MESYAIAQMKMKDKAESMMEEMKEMQEIKVENNELREILETKTEKNIQQPEIEQKIAIIEVTNKEEQKNGMQINEHQAEVHENKENETKNAKESDSCLVKDADTKPPSEEKQQQNTTKPVEEKLHSEVQENQPKDISQPSTQVEGIRSSFIMKTKGNIYFKKKGPFSSWKTLYVIIDEKKQQMNFYKSKEDYEKLSRCKINVDLRFVTELKPFKQRLLQNKFPFKLYRRAGLSTVKLAADNEEERAKWITTIEEIVNVLKTTPDRELEINRRSQTLPAKSPGEVSTDSETNTTASAPDNDELIRPKKVSNAGNFKIDSRAISSVKLKRTSSENRKFQQENKRDQDSQNPKEKFGVNLRRVNTEKPISEREKSPEFVEFKQKYNSLSLSRKAKTAKLPLNENSVCSQLVENMPRENNSLSADAVDNKASPKGSPRKRSPSPNIPMSKGVEGFVKKSEEEEEGKSSETLKISHAVEIVVENSRVSDLKEEFEETDSPDNKENKENPTTVPEIQLNNDETNSSTVEVKDITSEISKDEIKQKSLSLPRDKICPETCTSEHSCHKNMGSKANLYTGDEEEEPQEAEEIKNEEMIKNEEDDPLKVKGIKDFIVRMNSEAEDSENIPPKIVSGNLKEPSEGVQNIKLLTISSETSTTEEVRLSNYSFVSQLSTESDEPLPRLNFMGKSDRSSSGSTVAKDLPVSDDNKSDVDESSEGPPIIREKPKIIKRPESLNSLGGRTSLVSPEFTVVEEKSEEIEEKSEVKEERIETMVENTDKMNTNVDFKEEKSKIKEETLKTEEIYTNESIDIVNKENENLLRKVEEKFEKTEQRTEETLVNEKSEERDVQKNGIIVNVATEQMTETFSEEVTIEDVTTTEQIDEEVQIDSDKHKKPSQKPEKPVKPLLNDINTNEKKSFVNKIEMHLTSNSSKVEESKSSSSSSQTVTQISGSDDEFDVIDSKEANDYFPTVGGAECLKRHKEEKDCLSANQQTAMRNSGIVGLKEFLNDNQKEEVQVKSGINRLGHSAAIEKLKTELPK